MITTILTHLGVAVASGVICIFVYRNNTKAISKVADKVDDVWDNIKLQEKIDKLEEKIDKLLGK